MKSSEIRKEIKERIASVPPEKESALLEQLIVYISCDLSFQPEEHQKDALSIVKSIADDLS